MSLAYGSRVWAATSSHCKAQRRYFPALGVIVPFFRRVIAFACFSISSPALLANASASTGATTSAHPKCCSSPGRLFLAVGSEFHAVVCCTVGLHLTYI